MLITPSPQGCYRSLGFSPVEVSGLASELSQGRVLLPIGAAPPGAEIFAKYYTDPNLKTLSVLATGRVETLDPGFDWVRVNVNGIEVLYAESTQDTPSCGYEQKIVLAVHQIDGCLACGNYIFIEAALNDEICNAGVQWEVALSLS